MARYVVLFGAVFSLVIFILNIYELYRPKVGPIGNGEISTISWILIFSPLIMGISFLLMFISLSLEKRKSK
ncbi:hypothetical protein [Ureibacillus manganicus]|uniref:Uncharacterized protein n=1 Tax=Ureibacillus manganicus DSM 26584 TaxID=1384049 RepID=A0A0A3HPQ9_9BACL|nr:hypothetical protein [Ureibacillus manganicus]KGR74354.1 hypothetical protein CD29_18720 [Ureibacillus manganicus DSM 26584]